MKAAHGANNCTNLNLIRTASALRSFGIKKAWIWRTGWRKTMNQTLVPVKEIVAQGVGGRSSIYQMIKVGQIPSYRVGKRGIRVCLSEVLSVLRRPEMK
jgi:predicted DNA-binding transcriptional regulator AlpA